MLTQPKTKDVFITRTALAALVLASLAFFLDAGYLLAAGGVAVALAVFYRRPVWGLYAMALTFPFVYLEIFIGSQMNVPYCDAIAILVFIAWCAKETVGILSGKEKFSLKKLPLLAPMAIFIAASALSLFKIDNLWLGVKYILRPLAFFWLMFIVLPHNLVKSKRELANILWCFFASLSTRPTDATWGWVKTAWGILSKSRGRFLLCRLLSQARWASKLAACRNILLPIASPNAHILSLLVSK